MIHERKESVVPSPASVAAEVTPSESVLGGAAFWDAEVWREKAAEWLYARGVTSASLVLFALAFAGTAAFVLLIGHPGLGATFGLIALAAGELARVPQPIPAIEAARLVRGVNPLVDLLMLGGVFGGIASRQAAPMTFLAFLVLVLLAWLPMLRWEAGPVRLPEASGLWRRGERLGILLFGVLLGRPLPAMLMILLVCGLDAWLRVERMANPLGYQARMGSPYLQRSIREDGSLDPLAHWITLGVTILAIVLLPQSAVWRF